MTDSDRTVRIPVSSALRILDRNDAGHTASQYDLELLRALLSQPNPTAERWKERPHEVREDVDDYSMCLCGSPVAAALHDAEPPSIEDMAPGTTFRARRNNDNAVWHLWCWTGRALMRIGASTTAQGAIGDMDIDPSTIRDVTPPKGDNAPTA